MTISALPDEAAMFAALEGTWPPEVAADIAGCRLRLAPGAGSRVNSARLLKVLDESEIDAALDAVTDFYTEHGATPMIQLGEAAEERRVAERAAERGFTEFDPCVLQAVEIDRVADSEKTEARTLRVNAPIAAMEEVWEQDGSGVPARRAVMARGNGQMIAARVDDRIVGAVFTAVSNGICYEHALCCAPEAQRRGVGRALMREAARVGRAAGARWMAVSVRRGNEAGRGLFEALGFRPVGGYAYWRRDV